MNKIVVNNDRIVYVFEYTSNIKLTENGLFVFETKGKYKDSLTDQETTSENSKVISVFLPKFFEKDKWFYSQETDSLDIRPEYASELLSLYKQEKLREINETCQSYINLLTDTYPEAELLTFDKQESEAREYMKDKTAETPLLSALAISRGMTVEELASRVLKKADAFTLASGTYIGQRQKYEDQLSKAETIEEVQNIVPEYILPV